MVTALRRRVPHIPVVLAPAAVQGAQAPGELVRALEALYRCAEAGEIDVILLVRGGGSIEDLWAFNDEALARTIVRSPVPLVCGVGHETDFTIADFCADLRAPTPTAAAELVAQPRGESGCRRWTRCRSACRARSRAASIAPSQRLDLAAAGWAVPRRAARAAAAARGAAGAALRHAVLMRMRARLHRAGCAPGRVARRGATAAAAATRPRCERAELRLQLLDPRLVLQRGYALLTDEHGGVVDHQRRADAAGPAAARGPCRGRG